MKQQDLKFRAWSFEEEAFFYFSMADVLHNINLTKILPPSIENPLVHQYTGKEDKNGTEVFAGDILSFIKAKGNPYSIVVWDEENAKFMLDVIDAKKEEHKFAGIKCIQDGHRVIGNIFENSDLLPINHPNHHCGEGYPDGKCGNPNCQKAK